MWQNRAAAVAAAVSSEKCSLFADAFQTPPAPAADDFLVMCPLPAPALPAGCAFVQYSTWAACEAAIEALHDTATMPGSEHPLVVKFADAKKNDAALMPKRVRALMVWCDYGFHAYLVPGLLSARLFECCRLLAVVGLPRLGPHSFGTLPLPAGSGHAGHGRLWSPSRPAGGAPPVWRHGPARHGTHGHARQAPTCSLLCRCCHRGLLVPPAACVRPFLPCC